MRLPSKGICSPIVRMRGSALIFSFAASRISFDGYSNQLNTTTSSSCAFTAPLKSVSLPSGTSSPQHSTIRVAPNSLNKGAASAACLRKISLLLAGTAITNPSTYFIDSLPRFDLYDSCGEVGWRSGLPRDLLVRRIPDLLRWVFEPAKYDDLI